MDLREKLKYGDIRQIAVMAGVSYDSARSILTGRRGKRGGAKVKGIAADLIASREALVEKINKQLA